MNEVVKLVSQKTGLSEEMSRLAVETVISYLKTKLPAPLASQVDNILSGAETSGDIGGLGKSLSGLFGK